MSDYENHILRPALIRALSAAPDLVVHVAPVEQFTASSGLRRSSAELGAGTPDLLCSLRWCAWNVDEGHRTEVFGAQWLTMELKRPALPPGSSCTLCCQPCGTKAGGWRGRYLLSSCCEAKVFEVLGIGGQKAGYPTPAQLDEHAAWQRAGRWVYLVRTPAEGLAAVEDGRRRLRAAGLEPAPVPPPPKLPEIKPVLRRRS